MPVYNEQHYLEAVLDRVISQPLPAGLERELILVNDASRMALGKLCSLCLQDLQNQDFF